MDGRIVECVGIPVDASEDEERKGRLTVCVSSQVGGRVWEGVGKCVRVREAHGVLVMTQGVRCVWEGVEGYGKVWDGVNAIAMSLCMLETYPPFLNLAGWLPNEVHLLCHWQGRICKEPSAI